MGLRTKNGINFTSCSVSTVSSDIMEEIAEYLAQHYKHFFNVLVKNSDDAHLFLSVQDEKILCNFSIFGRQPLACKCYWEVQGLTYTSVEIINDFGYEEYVTIFRKVEGEKIILK